MSKISKEVSNGLSSAIAEVKAKISEDSSAKELLESGVIANKKRHRRTKAEMQAVREAEENQIIEEDVQEDNRPEWEKRRAKDHDEFCEWELQKAILNGIKDPDFDFRDYYAKDQIIYYILILRNGLQTKELKKLKIRTVYPRLMVCTEEKACCQCIGYEDKDLVFETLQEANAMFKTIDLMDEKELEKAQKNNKSKNIIDEDLDNSYTNLKEEVNIDDED